LKIAEGDLEAATASLTWDEFVWAVKKISGKQAAIKEGKKILGIPKYKIMI